MGNCLNMNRNSREEEDGEEIEMTRLPSHSYRTKQNIKVEETEYIASIIGPSSIRFKVCSSSIKDVNEAYIKLYKCMYEIMNNKPLPPVRFASEAADRQGHRREITRWFGKRWLTVKNKASGRPPPLPPRDY